MRECVLDASALIAYLRSEPGAEKVAEHLRGAYISAVNLSEVQEKALQRERGIERVNALLKNWQVEIVPFEADQAEQTARLKAKIGNAGISLADRVCLTLAAIREVPVLTADRAWTSLPLEMEIIQIRGTEH